MPGTTEEIVSYYCFFCGRQISNPLGHKHKLCYICDVEKHNAIVIKAEEEISGRVH